MRFVWPRDQNLLYVKLVTKFESKYTGNTGIVAEGHHFRLLDLAPFMSLSIVCWLQYLQLILAVLWDDWT